jgi:hypothetical protein
VAINADGSRVLVGAPYDDRPAGANAGSARVFERAGDLWSGTSTLAPTSDAAADDECGIAVALDAAGARALVGVYARNTGGGNAGSAEVYTLP